MTKETDLSTRVLTHDEDEAVRRCEVVASRLTRGDITFREARNLFEDIVTDLREIPAPTPSDGDDES